jgi:predicted transcriptional regulator
MEENIKAALVNGPKTVAELVKITGKSETTVRKTVKSLEAAGAVVKDGKAYAAASTPELSAGEKRGRGRPKDAFVQARDERVLGAIKAAGPTGITTVSIASALDITEKAAYISVWRLKKAGRVVKVLNGTRQPAYAEAAA